MKLMGKVALVAGGGQGIGEGIAHCLAEEGADVAISDINIESAKKVADSARELGRRTLSIHADLTDDDEARRTVKETVDTFGRIDILINNVGGVSVEMMKMMMIPLTGNTN